MRVTSNKINEFQKLLIFWFNDHKRDFPWRANGLTNYQLIIAEVLLQRTKAETVAKYYESFITIFPNWRSIKDIDILILEEQLHPLGLFKQRAERLKNLATKMDDLNGILPIKREDIEKIPLMGQYIANAVELMVYNKPRPLLDVNMARLLERYFGERKMADIRYDPYLQDLANQFVNSSFSRELNWAVMDFAAMVCTARNPQCIKCLLNKSCTYYKKLFMTTFVD